MSSPRAGVLSLLVLVSIPLCLHWLVNEGRTVASVLIPGFLCLLLALPALIGLGQLVQELPRHPSAGSPLRRRRFPRPPRPEVRREPICLVCQTALVECVVFCSRCRTPHHKECFRYLLACSVYGCGCRTYRLASDEERPQDEEIVFYNDDAS